MPAVLAKAHLALDRAVDASYGKTSWKTDADRVAFLFELFQQITAPLDVAVAKPPRRRAAKVAPA